MRNDTVKRLEALERIGGNRGSNDPTRMYEAMIHSGIEAPEPLPGEVTQAWLERVPSASLESILTLGGRHA